MTHCRREVLHAQWAILLDNEFLEAYKHGIVIECCDGVVRRFYPRILTYSADYPEKYVIPILAFRSWFLINAEFFWQLSVTKDIAHVLDVLSPAPVFKILG